MKKIIFQKNIHKKWIIIRAITRTLFIIGGFLLLTSSALAITSNPQIMKTISLATSVKPETFTELYFQNHTALPSKVISSKEYSFKFTIHNLEDRDMEYPYEAYLDLGADRLLIDKNIVFLKRGQDITIGEKFRFKETFVKEKIVVNLINKNQQIAFWVEGEQAR